MLNEKLLEVMGDDVTQEQAFAHANDVLKNAVGGISDIIHIPDLVNVDFEDVKTVMSEPGKAMMGTAVAGGSCAATTRPALSDERVQLNAAGQVEIAISLESDQPEMEIGPMKKRYTEEQIVGFLREADQVRPARSPPVHSTAHHAGSRRLTAGRR